MVLQRRADCVPAFAPFQSCGGARGRRGADATVGATGWLVTPSSMPSPLSATLPYCGRTVVGAFEALSMTTADAVKAAPGVGEDRVTVAPVFGWLPNSASIRNLES